jgi:hypothetical protein
MMWQDINISKGLAASISPLLPKELDFILQCSGYFRSRSNVQTMKLVSFQRFLYSSVCSWRRRLPDVSGNCEYTEEKKNSCGQPTRVVPPGSGLGEGLRTTGLKNSFVRNITEELGLRRFFE